MNRSIHLRQVKLIHALKGALKIDDDTYRAMLWEGFSVDSSKQLTSPQAESLIHRLEGLAVEAGAWRPYRHQPKFAELAGREDMATPAQLRMVEAAWRDVSRATTAQSRSKALRGFLKRITGVESLRFLEPWHVKKVMAAINAMKAAA